MNFAPICSSESSQRFLPSFRPARSSMYRSRAIQWAGVAALAAVGLAGAHAQNTFGIVAVGSSSSSQPVTVSSTANGTVKSVAVLTFGAANGDFKAGSGASTCGNPSFAGTCTEYVTFAPSAPGLRMGAVVVLGTGNTVLATAYLSGTGSGGLGVLAPGNVTITAGVPGYYSALGDGQQATAANLSLPSSITIDGAGNMYIADSLDDRVRMVCGATATVTIAGTSCTAAGVISTVVGNGKADYSGDGGPAAGATLAEPHGVALDGAGNLYIADSGNNVIRMISAATGEISTVAGLSATSTLCGVATDAVGDGCPAAQASLKQPWGVTLDAGGNLYIADTFEHRIRVVNASTGVITTLAGTGMTQSNGSGGFNGDNIAANTAELNYPYAVAFDPQGDMYIPDAGNQRVREVVASGGTVTGASQIVTFAGTGTQASGQSSFTCPAPAPAPANQTQLAWPEGVAVDAAGNVYIADTQDAAIRKVSVATATPEISTLVASGCGTTYVNGVFTEINLYGPMGLYLDGSGNLYIADYYNMVIREVQSSYVAFDDSALPVRQGSQSTPVLQTVENDGNAPLDVTALTAGTNTALGGSTTCAAGALAVDEDCTIAAVFAPAPTPALTGNQPENGTITTQEDTQTAIPAPSNPLNVQLFGIAEPVNGTTTTIGSTPQTSQFQQSVTFTVTVSTGTGTGNLTGVVNIADTYNGATTTLASGLPLTLNAAGTTGTVTFVIATLGVGQHSIVATYDNSSDPTHFSSSSTDNNASPLIQAVEGGTGTTLTSSLNPSAVGAPVTFTAAVTASGATADGTVTFMDGVNALGSPVPLATVGGVQQAQYSTSTLTNGPHQVTAVYSGDSAKNIQGSTSNLVVQVVQQPATLTLGANPNPSNYGTAVTFTATIQSMATSPATGTVVFLDNGAQIGTGSLAGNPGVATFTTSTLAVGTHPITATYAGDNYNSAAQTLSALSQVVNQAQTSTTVLAAPKPGVAGAQESITATVTVTAGAVTPSGTVTFTSGATTLGTAPVAANGTATLNTTALTPATYQVVATYGGNSNVNGSASAPLPLPIAQATTGTTLTESPTPALVALPITLTATVKGNGGVPGGTVNFVANGSTIGSATVNSSGVASITTSALVVGSYSVTANYLGDTDDGASMSPPLPLNVALATTAVTVSATPSPALVGQPVTFTANVTGNGGTPTGNVNFIANGNIIGSAALSGGKATLTYSALAAGTYTVTASYVGDADDAGSNSASISEVVELIPTATSLGSSSTTGTTPQVILVATVLNGATGPMPTGTVTFNNGTTVLGSATIDSSGVATLTPSLLSGTSYNITAAYGGDAVHAASTSAVVVINGTATGFNFSLPPAITLATSQNITVAVNVSSNSGFADTIALGCASLPVGVTCHFSPLSVALAANGTASSQLTLDTNNPLSGGASAMNRAPGSGAPTLAGLLLPFSAFFGWLLWRQRQRSTGLLTMVLVLALSAAALVATGCSGFSASSVAPGTYTIQVTGTGTGSNIAHYQNVTLTITK